MDREQALPQVASSKDGARRRLGFVLCASLSTFGFLFFIAAINLRRNAVETNRDPEVADMLAVVLGLIGLTHIVLGVMCSRFLCRISGIREVRNGRIRAITCFALPLVVLTSMLATPRRSSTAVLELVTLHGSLLLSIALAVGCGALVAWLVLRWARHVPNEIRALSTDA